MMPWTDLDDVLNMVWKQIEAGAVDPDHPFRTPTFGTAGHNQPQLRTVVLRTAQRRTRALSFHSDRRAEKVEEVRANERVAWHAWAPEATLQVRLRGRATVHTDDGVADEMWAAEPPDSLGHYLKEDPPATLIEQPVDELPEAFHKGTLTEDDVAPARSNFAVIRTIIDEIDALNLEPGNYQRALFEWDTAENAFIGSWRVP
ncbi:MAG: pyridoxamine 5'-phosphate oxidase family protein [Longimonas sp.]|uniref:pyridoxamine 5'-phosphate oxidase family protein n=1 Tax=Longimonas sp. TaxID=2039626 RepID=UPI003363EEAE